ncbi:MAG TPA: hypothetical protein VJM11_12735 [Nevskiaceae bacterium]|nr:hypothetical protein [Nevskiaceae bacterium]
MRNRNQRLFILAAALAMASGATLAGDMGTDTKAERDRGVPGVDVDMDARARMAKLDVNSDDKVSKAEASADKGLSAEFAKLDKDGNAVLDRGEFSKFEIDVDIGEPGDQPNRPYTKDDATDVR